MAAADLGTPLSDIVIPIVFAILMFAAGYGVAHAVHECTPPAATIESLGTR